LEEKLWWRGKTDYTTCSGIETVAAVEAIDAHFLAFQRPSIILKCRCFD